jgi:NAD(P)-dependent dehydrogenase (short-subunit alcohol dehydrogenase family)
MIGNVEDRVALVTGASSGMGAEIARLLAKSGASIAAVGRDRARLDASVARIEAEGAQGLGLQADLTQDGEADRVVSETVERFGNLDILVNAAGIFRPAPATEALSGFDEEWQINVRAPFILTAAALPNLRARRGAVLFISSVVAERAFPNGAGYCTTKGAVENLVRALAVEEAPNGVRVNAIAPGEIHTALNQELLQDPEYLKTVIDATPLGRVGEVTDVAPAAVFLVSDDASYITGASLKIDGGWGAQ